MQDWPMYLILQEYMEHMNRIIDREIIEDVYRSRPCDCQMNVLMSRGCQCGGA